MQCQPQSSHSVIQEEWHLPDLLDGARALHDALLDYEGDGVYADLLLPWLRANPPALAWLRSFAQRQGNPVPPASKKTIFKPGIADASTLYWADRRKGRPVNDLSHGWGSNSQWRTSFRRDYVVGDTRFYNVDGKYDLAAQAAETADDGLFPVLTLAEKIELLTQRCLVRSTTAHDDLFPYDDCWRESADNGGVQERWPRWLSALRGSGKRETKA